MPKMSAESWPPLKPVIFAILLCFLPNGFSSYDDDKITRLPGQPSVDFQQFSGYIPVDEQKQRALFYYFVEAETEPNSKPLVLFLTGGPGCSTIGFEAFAGNGAFIPKGNGLVKNMYGWNRVANMLYVDSPAGVGFSYSTNKSFYDFVNDEITANDNLQFLKGWLTRYPQYKNKDLFIAGVSYAGHYVPQLANLVLKSNMKPNLMGIAIANPLLDANTDYNSKAEYLWSHGLISDSTYWLLNVYCNFSEISRQSLLIGQLSPACSSVNEDLTREMGKNTNQADILSDLCISNDTSQSSQDPKEKDEEESSSSSSSMPDVCVYEKVTMYLRRKDVQNALNAKLVGVDQWTICSGVQFQGDRYNRVVKYDFRDTEVSTLPLLKTLVKSGVRVMVFSGDQDSTLPFIATRTHVDKLAKEMELNTTVPYQSWLQEKQVGGWTQAYGDKVAFATVRGAGHEPWQSQPKRSLTIFSKFLQGKSLPLAI